MFYVMERQRKIANPMDLITGVHDICDRTVEQLLMSPSSLPSQTHSPTFTQLEPLQAATTNSALT